MTQTWVQACAEASTTKLSTSLVAGGWWSCWLSSRLHWGSRSGSGGPHCVKSPSFNASCVAHRAYALNPLKPYPKCIQPHSVRTPFRFLIANLVKGGVTIKSEGGTPYNVVLADVATCKVCV